MDPGNSAERIWWWILAIPTIFDSNYKLDNLTVFSISMAIISFWLLTRLCASGGPAWKNGRTHIGRTPIPGLQGLPLVGSLVRLSHGLPHRTLARMALNHGATSLMAFSLGSTPVVVASEPETAREILTSPHFANRPLKQSAKSLMFSRAIGFAPDGTYWRLLRKIASAHLFAPGRIAAQEAMRRLDCSTMLDAIEKEQAQTGHVMLRKHIQGASLNNIMGTVFGRRYDLTCPNDKVEELNEIVREGFELLGAFNWCDYVPCLSYFYDPFQIKKRCQALVPRVRKFVKDIIEEHRVKRSSNESRYHNINNNNVSDNSDFVHVLLSLEGDEKLNEDDMVAVLWEMIFRGTDTTALLTEWVIAELVLNPQVQDKLQQELHHHLTNVTTHCDQLLKLPYLQAVIKETLRLHPPGPLLSWARLSTSDLHLTNGMVVPAHTTAMVNMWAITHDPRVWPEPSLFKPERFITNNNESSLLRFDVLGGDLRLAPFGAGRRSCPGKNLGLASVSLWVAHLVYRFKWVQDKDRPVDLSEVLKLSCEMKYPLSAKAVPRKDY